MSLYNMLFGRNPLSHLLLSMLGLDESMVGRFRDCYLKKDGEGFEIVVFTRNGGGNRQDYEDVTSLLRSHPSFVKDFDDDFDCTYASYVFKVPEKFKATADELATLGAQSDKTPMEKFKGLVDKLQSGDQNDPEVKRAMEIGKSIFNKLEEASKEGVSVVEV